MFEGEQFVCAPVITRTSGVNQEAATYAGLDDLGVIDYVITAVLWLEQLHFWKETGDARY
jgi:hypothetical protein